MKKFIFIFAALFLGLSQANAQTIYVDNFTAPEGGMVKFDVKYRGIEGKTIQGYIFKFEFPNGLSLVTEDDIAIFEYGDGNTSFDVKTTATGVQASPKSKNSQLAGNEGTLVTLTLQVNNPLVQGNTATVKVYDASLTEKVVNTDGTSSYKDLDTAPFNFDVTIGDSRLVFDENNYAPVFTSGNKYDVKIVRTIKGGNWSTIVLPCPVKADEYHTAFGDDVKIATLSGLKAVLKDGKIVNIDLSFTSVANTVAMAAGRPYLIQTTNDFDGEILLDNKTLKDVQTDQKAQWDDEESGESITGLFVGTYEGKTIPANGVFLNGNKFYYSVGKTKTKGLRGWFDIDALIGQDFGAKVGFIVDGEATSVDGIPSYQHVLEGVYDLSGRKIQLENGDLNKLQKGVYIINGKKVTIK